MSFLSHLRFGKHSHDEVSILAPLSQCCRLVIKMFTFCLYYYNISFFFTCGMMRETLLNIVLVHLS